MDMQKPGPWGRSSSINPGPGAAVECEFGSNLNYASVNFKHQHPLKIHCLDFIPIVLYKTKQSSDILQHVQNRPTGDRWLKF